MPYVGTPSCESKVKYDINDVENCILPIPSGVKIRDTYGKVINGNMRVDIVRMAFITKLYFNEFLLFIIFFLSLISPVKDAMLL